LGLQARVVPLSPLLGFFPQISLPEPGTLSPPPNSQLNGRSLGSSLIGAKKRIKKYNDAIDGRGREEGGCTQWDRIVTRVFDTFICFHFKSML
jgi:hypothetical protein